MPDPYANIAEIDGEIQAALAKVLEVRAAEPRQQEMLETYLSWIDFPPDARVLDVGCGTARPPVSWRAGLAFGRS